ncbi:hypothetical protein PI125_g19919 [Phytophthora idaei]|nr:hypothetical protein PI125_g19919 [Phytophthora idaei]
MRTSFTDAEDKILVQIGQQLEKEGLRITWHYVTRRMKTIKRALPAPHEPQANVGAVAKKLPTLVFHWTPNKSCSPKTRDAPRAPAALVPSAKAHVLLVRLLPKPARASANYVRIWMWLAAYM